MPILFTNCTWILHTQSSLTTMSRILLANRDEYVDRPASAMHFWTPGPHQWPHVLAGVDLHAYAQRQDATGISLRHCPDCWDAWIQTGTTVEEPRVSPAVLPGTWLGLSQHGRVSLVTNVRNANGVPVKATTRGTLVSQFVTPAASASPDDVRTYLEGVQGSRYSGFNLLAGTVDGLFYLGNRNEDGFVPLAPRRIHALTNQHRMCEEGSDAWPKATRGKRLLAELLREHPNTAIPLSRFLGLLE